MEKHRAVLNTVGISNYASMANNIERRLPGAVLAANDLSAWAKWLVTSTKAVAQETLLFLDRGLAHLQPATQRRTINRLRAADSSGVDAILHELLLFETCRQFGLQPRFEPWIGTQNPDLLLRIDDREYIGDVFVTNRPQKTLLVESNRVQGFQDRGEAAKKIADKIAEKASAYRNTGLPLILFVVFSGHDVETRDLETALYGASVAEMMSTGGLAIDCHQDWHCHGTFCPPGEEARHRNLSAVVGCDWFDTLAKGRPGRRLHGVVYHHWQPQSGLPLGSIGRFPEISWLQNNSGNYVPFMTGIPHLVMSTTSHEPEWAPYTADDPW